jgi:RNA polymerase sigma factor (sigma-70 family)
MTSPENEHDAFDDTTADAATELSPPRPEVLERLVQGHREFLAFLRPRVPSDAVAEEILQAAFVRTLEKGGSLREEESAVAWFYRLLRNALTDYYRRRDVEHRALENEAREPQSSGGDAALSNAVCGCMKTLLPTLKPGYAELLEQVDLEERPVGAVAGELGLTANNASVRLHRARKALRLALEKSCGTCATHGCLDCSCGNPKQTTG